MAIKTVGVVGCGLMGSGIAQTCAQAGYTTVVSEINQALLDRGMGLISSSLTKSVEKGKLAENDKKTILSRIRGTLSMDDFKSCDIVIEVVLEDMAEKKRVFSSLDRICPPATLLVSNTSCLSIVEMAMATKRPDKICGLHFFNPVPVMKLAEVVRTIVSSDETIKTVSAFGESLGKKVILAKDTPGFIVNRLFIPYLLDAIRLYESGAASKEDIDQGMMLGCNYPMGPLALADFVGLDTVFFVANNMFDEFKETRFSPPPMLRKMVAAKFLGRKTGKGFYEYR